MDFDFGRLFGFGSDQDPACVKLKTGLMMTCGECPSLWTSKLQIETTLSMFGADNITLYQVKSNLLPMRELFVEAGTKLDSRCVKPDDLHSTVLEDSNGAIGLAISLWIILRIKCIVNNYHFSMDQIGWRMGKLLELRRLSWNLRRWILLSRDCH